MLKYEHKSKPLMPLPEFRSRLVKHFLGSVCVIFGALFIGVLGYHELADLPWIDSLLNASMILGGMGPVDPVKTDAAKLFASFYALFSGIIFLVAVGVIFAPLFHRFLHKFHLAEDDEQQKPKHK